MTSHAESVSRTSINADSPRAEFAAAERGEDPERRGSSMVREDRPAPAPRPSPDMAQEVDRQSFDQRWADEAKAARKAAFIKTRKDPETGGQIRTLNQTFNR